MNLIICQIFEISNKYKIARLNHKMKHIPLRVNDFYDHCPNDLLNRTCEKFFQIWSHKAVNISNDLIEYTIRRIQNDRLRFLFQTRNEFTQQENVSPICQMSIHTENDLQRISV